MVRELSLGDRFRGVILGTAVGDAIGLPAEGLTPSRTRKLFRGRWGHRLVIHRGMVTIETEHTLSASGLRIGAFTWIHQRGSNLDSSVGSTGQTTTVPKT